MTFEETWLPGVVLLRLEPQHDERGYFARTWCARELAAHGLDTRLAQSSISYNREAFTLRGMHYQRAPSPEAKLVRCSRGAIHDVAVDLRPESATYKQWLGVELSSDNNHLLYIPPGVAHGFLTLADNTEVSYHISEFYVPELAAGVRWDDPAFAIVWPAVPRVLSARDRSYPDWSDSP